MSSTLLIQSLTADVVRHDETFLEKWFAPPYSLLPRASGVDISDSSIKVLMLKQAAQGFEIGAFSQGPLESGVVVNGIVQNPEILGKRLAELFSEAKAPRAAHVALPEEAAYVFTMHMPDARDRAQVRTVIEFEFEGRVPLKPAQAVYDYDIIEAHPDGIGAEIAVTVFSREVVEGYAAAFAHARVRLVSLEIEARSIARAIVPPGTLGATLMVDFGRARTGIAILRGSVPIFTSTVEVGGDSITNILMKELKVDEEKAEDYKNNKGLVHTQDAPVAEVISGTASALSDEIKRHYEYWDSQRNEHGERVTPIRQVLLTGGSSNLRGLPEYISGRVRASTQRADVWGNVCSFEDYVPSIDRHHALGLSTAIGLALRST
ncbi:MAG: pilus assembly protein PilM [Candidatus Pacebacteria bacterium]|nr:pilus assembly protein PilM [Candidatus Paceibacterota bacterium]